MLLTVAAANNFANISQIGFSGDRYPQKLPPAALEELGISFDDIEAMEEAVNREIEKAKIFLKVSE